jgi:hypothetical protein
MTTEEFEELRHQHNPISELAEEGSGTPRPPGQLEWRSSSPVRIALSPEQMAAPPT